MSVAALALLVSVPALRAAAFFAEGFDTPELNPNLEDEHQGFIIEDGMIHRDPLVPSPNVQYVRTVFADYMSLDFVAELSFTMTEDPVGKISFFGLGSGEPNPGCFNEVTPSLVMRSHSPSISGMVHVVPWDQCLNSQGVIIHHLSSTASLHRATITKHGDTVTFAIDENYDGTFMPDGATTFTGVQARTPWLTPGTSRIFFGTMFPNDLFDDLVIRPLGPTTDPPVVMSPPAAQRLYLGDRAQLHVLVTGAWPFTYQWHKDGVPLPGATNSVLTLDNVPLTATGDYRVTVDNDYGSVTSAAARVTVTERPWPYFEDFEGRVGSEWSVQKPEVTPAGNRRFLGQFGNETVRLTLRSLPAHEAARVTFDLFIINTWDGNRPDAGPDLWELGLRNAPTLLRTTFANHTESPEQAYPDSHPQGKHPLGTGASEVASLGYWMDAVYRLSFSFPHTGESLELDFSGSGLEPLDNESWGLDNVTVALDLTPTNTVYSRTELVSSSTWVPGGGTSVERVAASGNRAAVLCGDGTVHLLELGAAGPLRSLGRWEPWLQPYAIALAGNLVYIATYELDFLSSLEIVDFTQPAQPVLRGYYDSPGYLQDVVTSGAGLAYLADSEGGVVVLDVSDPTLPRRLGGYETHGSIGLVRTQGRMVYAVDGRRLIVLDCTDPSNPRRVGGYASEAPIRALQIRGAHLYLGEASGPIRILEATDPRNLRLLASYRGWGAGIESLVAMGPTVGVALGAGGLQVVDVADPTQPAWLTGTAWGADAQDVVAWGRQMLVAAGAKGLASYRLEERLYPPLKPQLLPDGMMRLSWPATEGIRLQMTSTLNPPQWADLPESETTNTVLIRTTQGNAFFRLVKGPKGLPGLVGYWKFDEGTGTTASDASGNGNHGAVHPGVQWTEGRIGGAVHLLARDDSFVHVPHSPSFDFAAGLTVCAWIQSHSTDGPHMILSQWDTCCDRAFTFKDHNWTDSLWLQLANSTGDWFTDLPSNRPILPSVWMHVAGTFEVGSALAALYFDGELDAVQLMPAGEINRSTLGLLIGATDLSPDGLTVIEAFDGLLDEVMLFNRALTADEIKAIYVAGGR